MVNLFTVPGALLLGLILGTVVAALAMRIPYDRPLLTAPKCVRSGEKLAPVDYIPILGYLMQRGKCRHCGLELPRWVPLTEAAMALLALLALIAADTPLRFVLYVGIIAVLLLIVVIDARLHEIYTLVLIAGAVLALLASFVLPEIDPVNALSGALVGGFAFFIMYLLARAIYKTEALGFGDVLLAILLGMISGFPGVVSTLFWGPMIGGLISVVLLIARQKGLRDYFPYAPGLCISQIGFLLTHLSNEPLWDTLRLPLLGQLVGFVGIAIGGLFTELLKAFGL